MRLSASARPPELPLETASAPAPVTMSARFCAVTLMVLAVMAPLAVVAFQSPMRADSVLLTSLTATEPTPDSVPVETPTPAETAMAALSSCAFTFTEVAVTVEPVIAASCVCWMSLWA